MKNPIALFLLLLSVVLAVPASAATRRHSARIDRCSVDIAPAAVSIPGAGGQAVVSVSVAGTGNCSWSPYADAPWISATQATGTITITAAANTSGAARTGLVHVRSAVIVVTQPFELTNLLTNGSFASNLANWSNTYSTGPGSATWTSNTPNNLGGAPPVNLGLALLTSNAPLAGYQLNQCVAVSPRTTYDAGASIFIPLDQAQGVAVFAIYQYDNPACTGNYLGSKSVNSDAPTNVWFTQNLSITTDLSTRGLLVVIGAGGASTPPFSAYFNEVYVRLRK